jgi:hypothetical protein
MMSDGDRFQKLAGEAIERVAAALGTPIVTGWVAAVEVADPEDGLRALSMGAAPDQHSWTTKGILRHMLDVEQGRTYESEREQ